MTFNDMAQNAEVLKEKFARLAEKTFDDLAYKAGVDIATNRVLSAEVEKLETSRKSLDDKSSSVGCAMLHFFGAALVALGILLAMDEPSRGVVKILLIVAGGCGLLGVLAIVVQHFIKKRIAALKSNIAAKKEAASKLMEPLNSSYTWDIPCRLIEEVFPRIKFDKYLTAAGLDELRKRYGWDDRFNEEISIKFALSGRVDGNPFVFCRYVEREWGVQKYTGTKDISWKEWEYEEDSDGKRQRKRVTRHQTLVAETVKPCPFFPERRFLVYASEVAPALAIKGDASVVNIDEEAVVARFKKAWGDVEVFYGEDFASIRSNKVNVFISKRLSAADIDTNPEQFARWCFDEAREFFLAFNNKYFEDVFLSLAPVMSGAATQANAGAVSGGDPSAWELEAIANRLGHPRFMPEDCKTRCILKAGRTVKNADGVLEVEVAANGYSAKEMTEQVDCMGEDLKNHLVTVPWPEYHETEGGKTMLVYAGEEPTATFKRRVEESHLKGPMRAVYAYVPSNMV